MAKNQSVPNPPPRPPLPKGNGNVPPTSHKPPVHPPTKP